MKGLRLLLGLLFAYHLGIGLAALLSTDATVAFAYRFYGTDIRVDDQFVYTLKALGMYALFTAAVIALPLWQPRRFLPLVYCVAALQAMRAGARVIFFDVLHAGFGVTWSHNLFNVSLLVAEVALLLFLARAVRSDAHPSSLRPPRNTDDGTNR